MRNSRRGSLSGAAPLVGSGGAGPDWNCAEKLEENPLLGRVVPEYQREDLREVIVGRYRLVYVTRSDEVVIARVVHGARELERVLGFEPWRLI